MAERVCSWCGTDSPKSGEWDRCECGDDVCAECMDAHDTVCEVKSGEARRG